MADGDTSSVATIEPTKAKPAAKPRPSVKPRHAPRYNVVLLDDDDHTYAYVIEMLGRSLPTPSRRPIRWPKR